MTGSPRSYVVVGPTASGKSALAMELAKKHGGEIVSVDSVQVYRGFDIGSAKPSIKEQDDVKHHLIDIKDWHEEFDARLFAAYAKPVLQDIYKRGKVPILVGGTGLYLRALWGGGFHQDLPKDEALRHDLAKLSNEQLKEKLASLDPKRAAQLHVNDRFRLIRALELCLLVGGGWQEKLAPQKEDRDGAYVYYLRPPRPLLHERIKIRAAKMLEDGLILEVEKLLSMGVLKDCKPMQSIGYKQACDYLSGLIPEAQLCQKIEAATRQYAKRQITWFNKVTCDEILS